MHNSSQESIGLQGTTIGNFNPHTYRILVWLLCISLFPSLSAAQANWDKNPKINDCTDPGYREYAAILWDIEGDWMNACKTTPAIFRGRYFATPTRCKQVGLQMWGEFDVPDRSCGWATPPAINSQFTDVSYVFYEQGKTTLVPTTNSYRTDFKNISRIDMNSQDIIRGWSWDGMTASYVVFVDGESMLIIAKYDGKGEFKDIKYLPISSSDNILGWSWDGTMASYVVKKSGSILVYSRSFDGEEFGDFEIVPINKIINVLGWSWDGSKASYLAIDDGKLKRFDGKFDGKSFGTMTETVLGSSDASGLRGWSLRNDFYMVFIANPLLQNDIPKLYNPNQPLGTVDLDEAVGTVINGKSMNPAPLPSPIEVNNSFVTQVNTLARSYNIKGVVVNGDLTDNGYNYEYNFFNDAYNKLNVDVYTGLGAKDFIGTDARDLITDQFRKITNFQTSNFDATTSRGSLAYSWDIGKVHFVQLNNHPDYTSTVGSEGNSYSLTSALSWLADDLDQAITNDKTVVLCYNLLMFDGSLSRGNKIYNDLLLKNVSTIISARVPSLKTFSQPTTKIIRTADGPSLAGGYEERKQWKTLGAVERRYFDYLKDISDAPGKTNSFRDLTEKQKKKPYYNLTNNIEVPVILSGGPIDGQFLMVHFLDNKMLMYRVTDHGNIELIKEIPFRGTNRYASTKEVYTSGDPDLRFASGSDLDYDVRGSQTADDFKLTSNITLTRIEFWGNYFPAQTLTDSDNFKVRIFGDLNGALSASPLYEMTLTNVKRDETATQISTGETIYRYQAVLNDLELDKDKTYWLSILNNTQADSDDDWAWATSSAGSCYLRAGETDIWYAGTSNFAFKLYGLTRY